MKQETGKISQVNVNSLSIQISLSGQAILYTVMEGVRYGKLYSIDSLLSHIARNNITRIALFLASENQATIPLELFIQSESKMYLAVKHASTSDKVYNNIIDDIVVVYPVISSVESDIAKLKKMGEVEVFHTFVALLHLTKKIKKDTIALAFIDNHLFAVAKKDDKIKFIDCFRIDKEQDIVSFVEIIIEKRNMSNNSVVWIGELSKNISDILIKRFNIN